MQKTLIIIGVLLFLIGVLWPWLGKVPIGRLPGDIIINKPNVKIFFPIATMIIISIIITIILWIIKK